MITPQLFSLSRASMSLLIGLTVFVCGCASEGRGRQAAYDREIQRAEQLLMAAGDADSLAAVALLNIGPTVHPVQRLTLIERAVAEAPDRPDLVWLNVRLCTQVDDCNPEPLESRLRALDPDNGAGWFDSIDRSGRRNDGVAVRKYLAAIAASRRFDTYWNATIVHITNAILKAQAMDLPMALVTTIGLVSATAIPPYQTIVNACKRDPLQDPDMLGICRSVSAVMQAGDTYLTEMIGIGIAKRAWPDGSPEYLNAVSAKRVAHYRMDTDAKLSLDGVLSVEYSSKRLELMLQYKTEQEVNLAEILNAKLNPDPPADWTDKWGGS